jgi:AcrR family transcriptional regulator
VDVVNPLCYRVTAITVSGQSSQGQDQEAERPLRADAERNRQRILDAARELFAERGLGVTLNDIAHHAGVGVGTVYRRFPDKKQLIDSLFEQRLEDLVGLMNAAIADPDPWQGLSRFLEGALELQAADRGLRELITGMPDGLERISKLRGRLLPLGTELVRRAQATGQLRADIEPQDVPVIQLMLATIIDAARDVQPELWRRFLAITLRGLAARPDEQPVLEPGPLAPEDVDRVMSALKLGRR